MSSYVGIDVCSSKELALQLVEQYTKDRPPRQNVKIMETKRINLYECSTDIASCFLKYDKKDSILYVVHSEM